jgi:polysaccharide deacetylase 2 family uncharacterized protein YibQ
VGKNTLAGLLMGTALGGAIAAVLSLQAAPPGAQLEALHAAAEKARAAAGEVSGDAAPAAMPEPEATAEARPEVEPAPEASASGTAEPAPETPIVEVPAGSEFAQARPEEDAATPATEPAAAAPAAPAVSEPAAEAAPDLPEVSTASQPESQTEAPVAPEAPAVTAEAGAPAAEGAAPAAGTVADPAPQPTADDAGNALPQLAEGQGAAAEAEAPADAPAGEPSDAPAGEPAAGAAAPVTAEAAPVGLADQLEAAGTGEPVLPGQKVGQLPTIGSQPAEPAAESAPDAGEEAADLPALLRYAAPFDATGAGPIVSIVLLDVGEGRGGVDEATIRAISFPVTIALDPASSNARERAGAYRAAGFELAILATNGLQRGMTAKDVEVAVEALSAGLPESVAMIPAPDALFQIDREVVKHLAVAIKDDGRGLITYARGLNVAGQAAEQADVPHASVDRVVDEYKEDAAAVRRFLDRAAFDAGQKGSAVIVAHAYPETLKALYDWVATGPKGVTLAPVSAGMIAARAGE